MEDGSERWSWPLVHVVVVLAIVLVGTRELFEKIGVLNRGRDLVVAAGPFAEVDATAAVGAEGEVFVAGEDDVATGGTAKGFDGRCKLLRHSIFILTPQS